MSGEFVEAEGIEMAGSGGDGSDPGRLGGNEPAGRFLGFWVPIIVSAIGGLMLGGLFLLGAGVLFAVGTWGYGIVFGVTGIVCIFLPALLVWVILRWMWRMMGKIPPEGQGE